MKARIYQPAKTAMQSGEAKTHYWLLEYAPAAKKSVEPLMGWTSSADTLQQLKMKFKTMEAAVFYATQNKIEFEISKPHARKKVKKSYADNFAYKP